jgi:hypothetical protein
LQTPTRYAAGYLGGSGGSGDDFDAGYDDDGEDELEAADDCSSAAG